MTPEEFIERWTGYFTEAGRERMRADLADVMKSAREKQIEDDSCHSAS